jgi:hypothetical protein
MPEDRIVALEKKIDAIYESTRKTQKYFLWTLIVTVALVVLPILGLVFAIPSFVSNYNTTLEDLDLRGL